MDAPNPLSWSSCLLKIESLGHPHIRRNGHVANAQPLVPHKEMAAKSGPLSCCLWPQSAASTCEGSEISKWDGQGWAKLLNWAGQKCLDTKRGAHVLDDDGRHHGCMECARLHLLDLAGDLLFLMNVLLNLALWFQVGRRWYSHLKKMDQLDVNHHTGLVQCHPAFPSFNCLKWGCRSTIRATWPKQRPDRNQPSVQNHEKHKKRSGSKKQWLTEKNIFFETAGKKHT